jgi:hypothetical protein
MATTYLVGKEMLYKEPWTLDAVVHSEVIVHSSPINRSKSPMPAHRSRRLLKRLMDVSDECASEYAQLLIGYAFQGSPPSQEALPYIKLGQSAYRGK